MYYNLFMLILNKKNVKDKLIQSGAVVFTPEIRLDSTVLVKDFEIRKFFKEALIELMYNKVVQPDVLIGFDNPGIIFSAMIACECAMPMVYVRATAKDHGKKNRIEGKISEGDRGLIFVDAIYSKEEIDSLKAAVEGTGCNVLGFLTIYSAVEDSRVFALTNQVALYRRALNKGIIRMPASDDKVEEYSENIDNFIAENAAETLLEIKAVALSPENPFRYASGILSPIYCDNRLLISHYDNWMTIVGYMAHIIKKRIGVNSFNYIGGTATAGIPHGILLADIFEKPFVWIKSNISSNIPPKAKVLIIEDLISTGKSSIEAVDVVRAAGGEVTDCISIFSYEMKKAEELFRMKNCRYHPVSTFSVLAKVAAEKEYIKPEDIRKITEWNKDPEGWGKKYGFED